MNILAVLYDVATPDESATILDRITVPGHGIDAPGDLYTSTYYFAWYLVRAFEHAGRADRYPALLQTWRDLLALHYTTWPESRGETRSDTHAWSAHPTADLLGLVAGIRPAAPGYARLRVTPNLGDLTVTGCGGRHAQGQSVSALCDQGRQPDGRDRSSRRAAGRICLEGQVLSPDRHAQPLCAAALVWC